MKWLDKGGNQYREVFSESHWVPPSDEASPSPEPSIRTFPLYMTPTEIRRELRVSPSHAVLGIAYDANAIPSAEVLPIVRGASLLLSTEGDAHQNGPLMLTLLRSLLRTHRNQCNVFGYGEMKGYFPEGELQNDNRFMHPGGSEDKLNQFFANILSSIGQNKVPVLFMDLLHRTEYRWGASHTPMDREQASAFDAFLSEVGSNILLIGSIGTDHTGVTEQLKRHFTFELIQDQNDPDRSPCGLAYWDPQNQLFVQAAANKYVQGYQSHSITTLDLILGHQFQAQYVEYDD